MLIFFSPQSLISNPSFFYKSLIDLCFFSVHIIAGSYISYWFKFWFQRGEENEFKQLACLSSITNPFFFASSHPLLTNLSIQSRLGQRQYGQLFSKPRYMRPHVHMFMYIWNRFIYHISVTRVQILHSLTI